MPTRPSRRTKIALAMAIGALVLSGCAGAVSTPASSVSDTGATLNGIVFSQANGTYSYWFAYGKTKGYGTETPHRSITISDRNNHPVSEPISGLNSGTPYHYQLCAEDSMSAIVCGGDESFTTTGAVTQLSIGAQPALFPGFDPAVSDYVTRCTSNPVAVSVTAPSGTTVAVNGQPPQSGNFTQDVPLNPGQAFTFATIVGGTMTTYHVRCLPADFPGWTYTKPGTPSQPFYIVTPQGSQTPGGQKASPYVAIFDDNGVPVWWDQKQAADGKLLPDGTLGWWTGTAAGGTTPGFETHNLDGTLVHTWQTVGSATDIHDFQLLANGDALLLSYPPRPGTIDLSPYGGPSQNATILEPEIQEIAPNGSLVWSWNANGHIDPSETGQRWWGVFILGFPQNLPDGRQAYDYAHVNSVQEVGNTIIVSMRHLDAVYAINRTTGQIIWKLGGTPRPESLTVLNDPESSYPLGGQHYARILSDGTVTIHDNNTALTNPPRAVHYQLDLFAKTAKLVEQVTDPDVPMSPCCGSAARQSDGSWLMSWGGEPIVTEFGSDSTRHFELTFNGGFSYRVSAIPSGGTTIAALRAGMDAMGGTANTLRATPHSAAPDPLALEIQHTKQPGH